MMLRPKRCDSDWWLWTFNPRVTLGSVAPLALLCLIILQIKSGEGGHIIGLRNLNWNLHKWNASVTSASHLMQRPTWRWRRWWRWPGWWWAKKRWWSYTDFCFVPCTLKRHANEQGVSYSDYVIWQDPEVLPLGPIFPTSNIPFPCLYLLCFQTIHNVNWPFFLPESHPNAVYW